MLVSIKRTMTASATTTTTMEPSSRTRLLAGNTMSAFDDNQWATPATTMTEAIPISRPDEPNLYEIPKSVYPSYRSLPWWTQFVLAVVSVWIGAVVTWQQRLLTNGKVFALMVGAIRSGHKSWNYVKILQFLATSLLIGLISNLLLQEAFLPPSRLSMPQLLQRYFLPSKLSKFRAVNLPTDHDGPSPLGVHYLENRSNILPDARRRYPISATYLNHGFGASSLSWLPTIPKIAERTGSRVVLSHDAPGFGFTERKEGVYTTKVSSEIGLALLREEEMASAYRNEIDGGANKDDDILLLMGHSMGCRTTVRMALAQPQDRTCWVVLVAPALGLMKNQGRGKTPSRSNGVATFLSRILVRPPLRYFLRRLVGGRNFWLKGLKLTAWGDPSILSASDVLRFQWPSIGLGWEDGLLDFSASQLKVEFAVDTDMELVQQLLQRPNVRVVVMCGAKDPVITEDMLQKNFLQYFPSLQETLVKFDDCGHDPFEEQVDKFCDELVKVLDKWNQIKNDDERQQNC